MQRLIRYVERWRLAHFQRPDAQASDRRVAAADDLLRKLHSGLQMAAAQASQGTGPAAGSRLYLH